MFNIRYFKCAICKLFSFKMFKIQLKLSAECEEIRVFVIFTFTRVQLWGILFNTAFLCIYLRPSG